MQRLWQKLKDWVFRKNNKIQKAMTSRRTTSAASKSGKNDELSALDKLRNENIQRNNDFLRSIGLDSTIKDIKERASKQCGKGNNRSDDASDEDCEDDVDSEVDESCDVQEEDFVDMRSAVKKHSAAVIDLSADKNNDEEEEDLKLFLYLKARCTMIQMSLMVLIKVYLGVNI